MSHLNPHVRLVIRKDLMEQWRKLNAKILQQRECMYRHLYRRKLRFAFCLGLPLGVLAGLIIGLHIASVLI